jgi:hypothetical protein
LSRENLKNANYFLLSFLFLAADFMGFAALAFAGLGFAALAFAALGFAARAGLATRGAGLRLGTATFD